MSIKKIVISFFFVFILILSIIIFLGFIGGFPVGFKNGHLLAKRSYYATDAGCLKATNIFYSRVKDITECEKLGGQIVLGG